ncbi:MAG: MFS transporter, partial [Gammaproteobacteria bacterium]
ISGWLADRFGSKNIFIAAMGIFTFSSILCAISTNLPFLILARMIQGFGGALMLPVGRLILLRTFSKAEFGKAMGMVIVPGLLGPTLGPTIGGLILHVATWHWIFLVNVPLGIIGTLVSYYLIAPSEEHHAPSFNWPGFLLFSLGLAAITFALAVLGDNFDLRNYAVILAIAAIILLVAYWRVSAKQERPLLDVELFKQKTFRISMVVSLIARPSMGAVPFLIPLLLQVVWGRSALFSGMSFMFLALGMISARFLIGQRLLTDYGYRMGLYIIILAITLLSMNLCWFSHPQPFYLLAAILFIIGIATSQFYTTIGTMTVAEVEPKKFSQATSISSTAQQFSAGVGIAMAAILLHLISKMLQQPLFSADVFFWTIIALNAINLFSLFFIAQLNPELKLAVVKT